MATLDTLSNLITNAKQTTSGKIEWTDTSLKGIQDEVKLLFSENGAQVAENVGVLAGLINDNSQLAIVTEDATLANNGVYFWNLTAVSAINFPAGSNGYWNILEFGVTSSIAAGYIPYSNGSNLVASYLQQTTDEIKMVGGSFVANKSTTTGPYFQAGDTDSVGNDIIFTVDDKNQVINSKKSTANKGIKLDFANNIHKIGDIDANKGLSVDTANTVYKLGNTASSEGVVINLNNGYIGNPTWSYVYNATTLVAGNASINLTLNDTANTATLGDGTKGLTVDVTNNGYILGNGTNGLNINTTGTYTLGNGTDGLSINTTTDDYTLGTPDYGLKVDYSIPLAATVNLGSLSSGNGLYIFNGSSGDIYNLANQTAGKGLFINLAAETYILGTFAGYGLSLTATTGRLGSITFGYNYTATTMIAGNSSINLTLDDTANAGSVGTTSKGLSVNMNSNLYKLGEYSTKGLFIDTNNQTYQLGFAASNLELSINAASQLFKLGNTSTGAGLSIDITNTAYTLGTASNGLVINTTGTYTLGNGTKGLSLNSTTNLYKLGDYTANTLIEIATATGNVKTKVAGLTTGLFLDVATGDFVLGTDMETPANASYFGARGTGGATPSIVMTDDFIDGTAPTVNPAELVRVTIPGIGPRWVQLYQ
jgi:hypothetical protein